MGLTGLQGWITNTLQAVYRTFTAAFENWRNPAKRTPVKTTALKTVEEAFIPVYMLLHQRIGVFQSVIVLVDV
jgi:hypothetical protein